MILKKKIFVVLIVLAILIVLVAGCIFVYINFIQPKPKIVENTTYLPYNQRYGTTLTTVYSTYLSNYYSDDNTLVIFWASWCHNCQEETQAISTLMAENPNKKIVVVSHDRNKEDLVKYISDNNLKWFVIFDTNRIIRRELDPQANSVPNTYLLDNKGTIVNHYSGKMDIEKLRKFIKGETVE